MCRTAVLVASAMLTLTGVARAHVPYLESDSDYSADKPFVVENVENSKSLNASLDSPQDYDVYSITLTEPARIFTTTNIPYCPQYADFTVTYALTGPGLPDPGVELPVELPPGYGAVVIRDTVDNVEDRPVFFEPYGGRLTWEGPEFAIDAAPPGEYRMIVWNENGRMGDYIAVIGQLEVFGPAEIAQTRKIAPLLKNGGNLMVDCNPQADATDGPATVRR